MCLCVPMCACRNQTTISTIWVPGMEVRLPGTALYWPLTCWAILLALECFSQNPKSRCHPSLLCAHCAFVLFTPTPLASLIPSPSLGHPFPLIVLLSTFMPQVFTNITLHCSLSLFPLDIFLLETVLYFHGVCACVRTRVCEFILYEKKTAIFICLNLHHFSICYPHRLKINFHFKNSISFIIIKDKYLEKIIGLRMKLSVKHLPIMWVVVWM